MRTQIRKAAAVLIPAAVVVAGTVVAAPPASAATCRTISASTSQAVNKFLFYPGWGATSWRVNARAYGKDSCTSGSFQVSISFYDANVKAKGGEVRVSSVAYQSTSFGSRWIPIGRIQTWPNPIYSLPRGCMANGERITKIRIVSSVWAKPEGASQKIGISSATTYLTVPR